MATSIAHAHLPVKPKRAFNGSPTTSRRLIFSPIFSAVILWPEFQLRCPFISSGLVRTTRNGEVRGRARTQKGQAVVRPEIFSEKSLPNCRCH